MMPPQPLKRQRSSTEERKAVYLSNIKVDYVRQATSDFLAGLPYVTPNEAIEAGERTFDDWLTLLEHYRDPPADIRLHPQSILKKETYAVHMDKRQSEWITKHGGSAFVRQLINNAILEGVSLKQLPSKTRNLSLYRYQVAWLKARGGAKLLRYLIDRARISETS